MIILFNEREVLYNTFSKMDRKELYDIYQSCELIIKTEPENEKLCKKKQMVIRDVIDRTSVDFSDTQFPSYNNENLITELTKKPEFYYLKNRYQVKTIEDECDDTQFELGNHQEFLREFMNEKTPYNSLLVFHGVGVGKTCSAVTVSRNFIDIYKRKEKKIICLVSKNIRDSWKRQIYDPSKNTNQCTGDFFHSMLPESDSLLTGELLSTKKKTKKMIRDMYEFYGYREFYGKINRMIERRIGNRDITESQKRTIEINTIRDYFNNRLLIIDEVHNLRDESETHSKDTLILLDKIIKIQSKYEIIDSFSNAFI